MSGNVVQLITRPQREAQQQQTENAAQFADQLIADQFGHQTKDFEIQALGMLVDSAQSIIRYFTEQDEAARAPRVVDGAALKQAALTQRYQLEMPGGNVLRLNFDDCYLYTLTLPEHFTPTLMRTAKTALEAEMNMNDIIAQQNQQAFMQQIEQAAERLT